MKWIVGMALAALMATTATAADAVLRSGSKEAYEASLLAMAAELGPDQSRLLILDLAALVLGPAPAGTTWSMHLFNGMNELQAKPDSFYSGLAPYEGKTAAEISALAAEIRKE